MMSNKLILSPLPHTWIFDVDGTLVVHNGYKTGEDIILDGVQRLFQKIPANDMIILLTSRTEDEKDNLRNFLQKYGLRYDHIIFNVPVGERILVNDDKPSGLKTSYAIGKRRDEALEISFLVDENL